MRAASTRWRRKSSDEGEGGEGGDCEDEGNRELVEEGVVLSRGDGVGGASTFEDGEGVDWALVPAFRGRPLGLVTIDISSLVPASPALVDLGFEAILTSSLTGDTTSTSKLAAARRYLASLFSRLRFSWGSSSSGEKDEYCQRWYFSKASSPAELVGTALESGGASACEGRGGRA